ncbi:ABC transporter ATP-binding protein [Streptomyces sp. NPDC091371]|uniref:ABC transporter ATP-binding protein n=1 Tax=Streptomyces sp. NPDC091371 TaxID=3155303 RepID=UPI00344899A0
MRSIVQALGMTWRAGKWLVGVFLVCTIVSATIPIALAWVTKLLLDVIGRGEADTGHIAVLGAVLGGTGLLAGLLPHVMVYLNAETERRVGLLAQNQLFLATERFVGLARFEDPAFLDRLRLALQSGGSTPGAVVAAALSIVRTTIMVLGFLGSLFVLSPWMPLMVVLSAVPALGGQLWLAKRRAMLQWELGPTERREIFYRDLLTSVQAAKEIRLFGTGAHLRDRMMAERGKANRETARVDRRELLLQAMTGFATALFAGGALMWAVLAAAAGRISIGDVSLLIASIAGVQSASVALMREIGQVHQKLLLFQHFRQILDSEPDLPVAREPVAAAPLSSGIEFRDVWFRYSAEQPWVVRGVDLTIPHGQTLGLIGRNGAGKSTLVKLLCRMYDPERGAILWDGVDLRDIDPAELRERIGAVFQDYMNYDLTAAENIALGDLSRSHDQQALTAAAEHAGAHELIQQLPDAYDTLLSRIFFKGGLAGATRGVTLSGGQWQRMALARAYMRGARDLLILDEPSSGLDAETEHRIHVGLREHRKGRTSVLISHRLGAVREADLLVVLDDGEITERGTHDELIALDGLYARMFHVQAEGYQTTLSEVP